MACKIFGALSIGFPTRQVWNSWKPKTGPQADAREPYGGIEN